MEQLPVDSVEDMKHGDIKMIYDKGSPFYYIEYWIRRLIQKLFNKPYDYCHTDIQKWFTKIVLDDLDSKGLEMDRMDKKGHVRRKGDGIP